MGWLALASVPGADPPAEPAACSGCHPASGPSARPVKESEGRRAVTWWQMLLVRGIPRPKARKKSGREHGHLRTTRSLSCPACCSRPDDTANSGEKAAEGQDTAGSRTPFNHFVSQPFPRAEDDASCKHLP